MRKRRVVGREREERHSKVKSRMETFITLLHVLITEIMLYKLVTKVERKHLTLLVCLIVELISYKLVTKVELKHLTLFFLFFYTF